MWGPLAFSLFATAIAVPSTLPPRELIVVNTNTSSSLLSQRPPAPATIVHDIPDTSDTLTYKFSDTPMTDDDISFALIYTLFDLNQQLDGAGGDSSKAIKTQSCKLSYGNYFIFDIGLDLYSKWGNLKLKHLKDILDDITVLQQEYELREFTFTYAAPDRGRTRFDGSLKNGPESSPPRRDAPAEYELPLGPTSEIAFFGLGAPLRFQALVDVVLHALDYCWYKQVQQHAPASSIRERTDTYSYTTREIGWQIIAYAAQGQRRRLKFDRLLPVTLAVAVYGRQFNLRALRYVMTMDGTPIVTGSVADMGSLLSGH